MIRTGWTRLWGKDTRTAQALLAAADRLGIPQDVIRTDGDSFIMPDEIADEAAQDLQADPPDPNSQF